jgi:hypothetical protein
LIEASGVRIAAVRGTDIIVIARRTDVSVNTSQVGITAIVGAEIVVVAIGRLPAFAFAIIAGVVRGAGIVVVAISGIVFVLAPGVGIATIVCTRIVVVAIGRLSAFAFAIIAGVVRGAGIAVVA